MKDGFGRREWIYGNQLETSKNSKRRVGVMERKKCLQGHCGHIVLKVYVKEYISVLLLLNLHNFAFLRQRQTFDLGIIRLVVVKVKRVMKR